MRRFTRFVAQHLGTLIERDLSPGRPHDQSRVLWEIEDQGTEVRTLRRRLHVDATEVRRLLRLLGSSGLVELRPSSRDRRVRVAVLTRRGRRERDLLDRRNNDLARSLLEPLTDAQRHELGNAMNRVTRLLAEGMLVIEVVDPASEDAQHCLHSYFAELDARFDTGFDPTQSLPADLDEMRWPAGLFLLARLHDEPVGCGALKFHGDEPAELKRMWVGPQARGLGVGSRLLHELEARARQLGVRILHLETNGSLTEAIAMYRSHGYVEVEPFNDERYAQHWFEKQLVPRLAHFVSDEVV